MKLPSVIERLQHLGEHAVHTAAASPHDHAATRSGAIMQPAVTQGLAAVFLLLVFVVPTTYVVGVLRHGVVPLKKTTPIGARARHMVLSAASVLSWIGAVAIEMPFAPALTPMHRLFVPDGGPVTGASPVGAAVVACLISEVLMVSSFLVCHSRDGTRPARSGAKALRGPAGHERASDAVLALGTVLAVASGLLVIVAEVELGDASASLQVLYFSLSAAALLVSFAATHGLGGWLRFQAPRARQRWRFFQPFRGSYFFVATQAAGWGLFSLATVGVVAAARLALARTSTYLRGLSAGVAVTMVAGQVLLAVSVRYFQVPRHQRSLSRVFSAAALADAGVAEDGEAAPARGFAARLRTWTVVGIMYAAPHSFVALVVLTFAFLSPKIALALHVAWIMPYLAIVGPRSHATGVRRWPALQAWLTAHLDSAAREVFGGYRVIFGDADAVRALWDAPDAQDGPADGSKAPSSRPAAQRKVIFGYHPHGLFPVGAAVLPLLPAFQAVVDRVRPVVLTASAAHFPPLVRDLLAWVGCRKVTRSSFRRALSEERAVLLVPGGQRELVHTHRMHPPEGAAGECVLVTRHTGFLKMAVLEQAHVVPVVVFGEAQSLRNIINIPSMQHYTYRKFGFPIPFLIGGRWKLSPLPQWGRVTFVVGSPMAPPAFDCHVCSPRSAGSRDGGSSSEGESEGSSGSTDSACACAEEERDRVWHSPELKGVVEQWGRKYFAECKALMERFKAEAGYPDLRVLLLGQDVSEEDLLKSYAALPQIKGIRLSLTGVEQEVGTARKKDE
ncbi:unnamed protein product [Pedinophyceae sp. YPF-701]|nr:unnamed protein product [Pedinophyceae sp. YPF-701]